MATVLFPDGTLCKAPSWNRLEKLLRLDSWNPEEGDRFRKVMANRAWMWSGSPVDVELVSSQFFQDLEAAGLLMVVKEET